MKAYKYSKGVTVLELTVILLMFTVLAAIVLVAVSTSRNKTKDASARSSLNSLRNAAELVYASQGNYNSLCGQSSILDLLNAAKAQTKNQAVCSEKANSYTVYMKLVSGDYYCVDAKNHASVIGKNDPANTPGFVSGVQCY